MRIKAAVPVTLAEKSYKKGKANLTFAVHCLFDKEFAYKFAVVSSNVTIAKKRRQKNK
jgi:hypothetical protein